MQWQIDTTMRSGCQIDRAAKASSPGSIMHSDIAVKRHPVIDRGLIIRTTQYGIFRLISKSEYTGRRHAARSAHVAGYKICLQYDISALEQIQMLIGQIDLHIGITDIVASFLCSLAAVYRLLVNGFSLFNRSCQLFGLFLTVGLPAVGSTG